MAVDLEQKVLTKERVAIVLVALALALVTWPAVQHIRETPPPPSPSRRLSFPPPAPEIELGTGDETLDAAISPDEREVVFVATSGGIRRLWRRKLAEDAAAPLMGTDGAGQPAWKPTGNIISFSASGKIKQIALTDGSVTELADAPEPSGATWQADGSLVFASGSQGPLRRLRNGKLTDATALRPGDRGHTFPVAFGNDGLVYIALREDGRRTIRVATNGAERDQAATSGHAQLIGDLVLHVRDGTLLAQRFDVETGTLIGRGAPLGLNVGVSSGGRALMAASSRLLLFAPLTPTPRQLTWFDMSGRRIATSGEPGDYWQARISPDDRYIAATIVDPLLRGLDVFVFPASGSGGPSRLTLALAADTDPVWSPDGTRVLFRSFQDGQPNLYARRVGVRGASDELILRTDGNETPTDWWADSRSADRIAFSASTQNASADVMLLDVRAKSKTSVANSGFNETDARWSPDRRSMAYVSDESGRPDVYVLRWPERHRVRISFAGGARPRWAPDGRALFFLRDDQLMRADRRDARSLAFESPRPVLVARALRDFDVAHRSNKMLLLMPLESTRRPEVRAIVDWQSLVPARSSND